MRIILLCFLSFCTINAFAQKESENNKLPLVFSAGAGIGKTPIFINNKLGIAGMLEFGLWRNISQVNLSYHSTGELILLAAPSPNTTSTSMDLNYGRVLLNRKIKIISNVGIGVVKIVLPGQYLYSGPGLFGRTYYEKLKFYAIGLPLSTKIILIDNIKFGIGLEGYVNLNKNFTFYMVNFILMAKNK